MPVGDVCHVQVLGDMRSHRQACHADVGMAYDFVHTRRFHTYPDRIDRVPQKTKQPHVRLIY